jgi:hypothetical protein
MLQELLRKGRHLLVLDNLEVLLQGGHHGKRQSVFVVGSDCVRGLRMSASRTGVAAEPS